MNVMLTGSAGQAGIALARARPAAVQLTALSRQDLDVCDEAEVWSTMNSVRPELVVNAAAYTAVDRAESEPEAARLANEVGPANLARAARQIGARLIHLSTDYVFDGESSVPYEAQSATRPLGVYGRTKLAGEQVVRSVLPDNSVVIRTAWLYSAHGHNFVRTMLRLMKERGAVRVVADQIGSPTAARSLAEVIWAFAMRPGLSGVYHWTDAGAASWYDFAVAIAEEGAACGKLTGAVDVQPITTDEYPTQARRPRFSMLDTRSTRAAIGARAVHWRVWLRRTLAEMVGGERDAREGQLA